MYNVSQSYLDALGAKAVKEAVTGTLTLPESDGITINDSNLVRDSLKLTKELCGERYRIGTFNLSCLRFSFFTDDASALDLTGGSVSLSYRLAAAGEQFETVPLGTFLVDPILSARRGNIISIVAYDAGVKADKEPSTSLREMTGTPAELIIAACSECGIDTDIDDDSLDDFPNSAVTVSPADRQIQSCRDIIMWCAYLLCGYAVIDRNSKLKIIPAKYSASGSVISADREVTANERRYFYATDTRAYIKYMSAYKGDNITNYTSTYVSPDTQAAPAAYALDKNPLLAGKTDPEYDAVNRAWLGYIDTFKQRGIKTCIYGDPAIDPGDTLMFRGGDVDQRSGIIGVVTSYEWNYRVGHVINCSAADCVGSLVSQSFSSTQTRSQTQKRIDAIDVSGGSGGVGENVGNHNERFNGYTAADGCTITSGDYNHGEGYKNTLIAGRALHIGGSENNITDAEAALISGSNNTKNGGASIGFLLLGAYNDIKSGAGISSSFVGGSYNTIYKTATNSIIIGASNQILGNSNCYCIIVAGNANKITDCQSSIVCGQLNDVSGSQNACFGGHNKLTKDGCLAVGYGADTTNLDSRTRFVIGSGSGNAIYATSNGNFYATGGYNTMGADYAEYFEWADGNPDNEDRRGMLVALDGDRIVPASGNGFLGVISANPSVVGNSAVLNWEGKYKRDVFGCTVRDENGEPILNPDYDPEKKYIPREQRPEWAAVGLVGRLVVTDDGSCKTGGYCTAKNGTASYSKSATRARVLKRIDDTHVEVFIR